jgi:hypothetical protein
MTSDYWRQVTIHMGMISHGRQHSGMIVWTLDGLYLVDCNTGIRMSDTLREVLKEGGNAGPSRAVPESGQTRNQIFSARPIPSDGQTPTDNVPEGGLSCPWTTQVSSAPTDTLSGIGIFATGVYAIYWWGFIGHHFDWSICHHHQTQAQISWSVCHHHHMLAQISWCAINGHPGNGVFATSTTRMPKYYGAHLSDIRGMEYLPPPPNASPNIMECLPPPPHASPNIMVRNQRTSWEWSVCNIHKCS